MEFFDCIGCDIHKDYSVFRMFDAHRKVGPPIRIRHENGELERFLKTLPPGSHVGFEACGSWMGMARQVEEAGSVDGPINLSAGSGVWDLRDLVRTRLAIRRQESAMKNRVHGVLNQ
jgi:hypothetical protein